MRILIINGPNLNLLGRREPEIYGNTSFEEYLDDLKKVFPQHDIDYYQSNHEGCIIDKLQEAWDNYDGIVLNPGGYAHTSIAIADCIRAITIPVVEVHISDIYQREEYRRHSYTGEACLTMITGQGLKGYEMAIKRLIDTKNI